MEAPLETVLQIGGVSFRLRSTLPLLKPDPDRFYHPFLLTAGDPHTEEFLVDILEDGVPGDAARKTFDAGPGWEAATEADGIWFRATGREPRWAARVTPTGVKVHIASASGPVANPFRYPLDQLVLGHLLAGRGGFIVHAAGAVSSTGGGFVLCGKSGAGKTTMSRLILEHGGARVIGDDRVVVREESGRYRMFDTPWPGEAGMVSNTSAPLEALVFLSKGKENRLDRLAPEQALEEMLPVVSVPWYDPERSGQVMETMGRLVQGLPAFRLGFRTDLQAVDCLLSGVDQNR